MPEIMIHLSPFPSNVQFLFYFLLRLRSSIKCFVLQIFVRMYSHGYFCDLNPITAYIFSLHAYDSTVRNRYLKHNYITLIESACFQQFQGSKFNLYMESQENNSLRSLPGADRADRVICILIAKSFHLLTHSLTQELPGSLARVLIRHSLICRWVQCHAKLLSYSVANSLVISIY